MIENILKLFAKEPPKEKLDPQIFIHYSRRDPETNMLEEKMMKEEQSINSNFEDWKRLKVKSYDVKKLVTTIKGDSFVDEEFPHDNSSISDEEPQIAFEWKRIPQIVKFCIYSSAETYQNFERISMSNKRLKEALVFMYRTHPTKFKQFLAKDCNENGLYEFKLYHRGIVENVIIDDYVPVVNGTHPLMMGPIADRQIFPMLIEKAIAKVCGGYDKIPENLDDLLQILFCGPLRKTKIDELSNTEVVAKTVENTLLNNGVAAFISKNQPKIRSFGISQNQLYHIIHKFSVNVKNESVQLYQLISQKRLAAWNGKFSHNDAEWEKVHPAERSELFKQLNKNKSFFVSCSDVSRIFDHLIVFDGTDIMNKDWIQLESEVLYPSFSSFQLYKSDQVFLRVTANDFVRTSVILAKHIGHNQYRYISGAFHENNSSVQLTVSLKPGKYIICTHHDWILDKQGQYSIFMSSDSHSTLKFCNPGEFPNFLEHLFKMLSEESKKAVPTPSFLTINKFYTIGMLAKQTGFAFVDFSLGSRGEKEAIIQIDKKVLLNQSWEVIEPHANRKTIQMSKGEQEELLLILKTHKYVSQQIIHFPSTAFRLKV